MDISPYIRNVPDFPHAGIQFKDVTTLLLEPKVFQYITDTFKERYASQNIDAIVGMDARGFIFGAALAYAMGLPFVLARKKGKLPADTIEESFELEYGHAILEMHIDSVKAGQRILIIDDLLATGGTTAAVVRLLERMNAVIVEAAYVVELPPLKGRERLAGVPVYSMVEFMVD